jgi:hypothetical protein
MDLDVGPLPTVAPAICRLFADPPSRTPVALLRLLHFLDFHLPLLHYLRVASRKNPRSIVGHVAHSRV